jgi:hypothetical protein
MTGPRRQDDLPRVTDPAAQGGSLGAFLLSPRIEPGQTVTFTQTVTGLAPSCARSPSTAAPRDGTGGRGPDGLEDDLAFAVALAARAGEILMDRYERLERIDYKSARDVVTEADHQSEALILDAIRARHPGDAIVAEETGEHHADAGSGEAATSGRAACGSSTHSTGP